MQGEVPAGKLRAARAAQRLRRQQRVSAAAQRRCWPLFWANKHAGIQPQRLAEAHPFAEPAETMTLASPQLVAQDELCADEASKASRLAVVKHVALPPEELVVRLVGYAQYDLANLVRCVLAAGASPDARYGPENTPVLCFAARFGSVRAMKVLLAGCAGKRPGCITLRGGAAICFSAKASDVGALGEPEGSSYQSVSKTGCLPVFKAPPTGREYSAVPSPGGPHAGADVHAADSFGWTPLHIAAREGHLDCVAVLLAAGARLSAQTSKGYTPLVVAQHFKPTHAELLEMLSEVKLSAPRTLSGPWHAHSSLPYTVCDHCGVLAEPGRGLKPCNACRAAWYCDAICEAAAARAHGPKCDRLRTEVEELSAIARVL